MQKNHHNGKKITQLVHDRRLLKLAHGIRIFRPQLVMLIQPKFIEHLLWAKGFPGGSVVKNPPANTEVGSIRGRGRSVKEEMAMHSSILAWEIQWIEEPTVHGVAKELHTTYVTKQPLRARQFSREQGCCTAQTCTVSRFKKLACVFHLY